MTAQAQLTAFLSKYSPDVAATAKKALARLRKRVPGAFELVYDNYNALAIGFGPTDRASDIILSIALYPRWVSLFFVDGVKLRDAGNLLKGSGKGIRHVVLQSASDVDEPAVAALIEQAVQMSPLPLPGRRKLIIKSVSEKQRPRRPA